MTPSVPDPKRFTVAPRTLRRDRAMNYLITIGGVSVIVAVLLIFIFLVIQILPLFGGATVTDQSRFRIPRGDYVLMGSDELSELPFLVERSGRVLFYDTVEPGSERNRGAFFLNPQLPDGPTGEPEITAIRSYRALPGHDQGRQDDRMDDFILYGTSDGRFVNVGIRYRMTFPQRDVRVTTAELQADPVFQVGRPGYPVTDAAYADRGRRKLVVVLQDVDGITEVHAATLAQQRSLLGAGTVQLEQRFDLTSFIDGTPWKVLIPREGDGVIVATRDGEVHLVMLDPNEGFVPRQVFRPFDDLANPAIASMDFVLGNVSLVFTHAGGASRTYSIYRDPELDDRVFGRTKEFAPLPAGAEFFSPSLRNKAFLVGGGNFASLRYNTTADIRWESMLPFTISHAVVGPRYDLLLFLDDEYTLHKYSVSDPHPRASLRTYFTRIHYEGLAEPSFVWQSSGSTDDFESKLSMVPLIIGTLKGTFYALVFALPIALLAAVYTSQFMKPDLRRVVKPALEIMASLPSVVLGFIAALWLAPIVSNNVPSIAVALVLVIAGSFGAGWLKNRLPARFTVWLPKGFEFLAFIPIMIGVAYLGWVIGAWIESVIFVVTDPNVGVPVPDFRLWFSTVTGLPFEQRNSLVVGFVMGFAVIPIIFTIAEDSMSNVPDAFRSGSLALGASRWQTAVRIVLPTAAAGIFSAVMIGLGRAVGETMIVVMATGNVAVTEFNIFTGMRTLSANIAVELGEAPEGGTLYRSLFLGALILFMFTFTINTFAELMRQRLRDKFKAVE